MRLAAASPSAIALLRVLLAASIFLPLLLFSVLGWFNYGAVMRSAQQDLLRSSEVGREFVAKVFDSQSQVADRVNDLVRGLDATQIEASQLELHEAFANITAKLPHVQSVLLIDRRGRPLVSAGIYPVPADASVADRDYFQAVMGGFPGTYVSSLQTGTVNRQQFFGVARPWIGADGKLAGVIDVAVTPTYIRDFFGVVAGEGTGERDTQILALVRSDGAIVVRYPDGTVAPSSKPEQFLAARERNPDVGLFRSRSIVQPGAPARIYAYRAVQGFPVYVLAGRNVASVIDDWREIEVGQLLFGVPAAAIIILITWTALVRARREQGALSLARQEIARREEAEAALLRTQRLEAVGQLTGGVAHDFNNLLTVIMGSAELLARRADEPARVRQIAEQIALAARRGGDVTQQLLAFSRRQFVSPEIVDLNQRLRDFRQLLDRAARETVEVALTLTPACHPVRLDPGHFEAAILNLVGNARDAMPGGGTITITTANVVIGPETTDLPAGDYVRVAVIDTGTGMDAQTAAKAFEPFFTTKDIGKGTGLGLSQVYGFAKQAGGDVRIRTAPGEGTTVELFLPRADPWQPPAQAPAETLPSPSKSETVLVVEDEPGVRATTVEMLRDLGYTAVGVGSGPAAIEVLRKDMRVDLLLSDVVMPGGMDGASLAGEAKRLRPELKVLLISGYSTLFSDRGGLDIPLLPKPYDRGQLLRKVQAVLHES